MIETILSTATLFCAVLLILLITIWVVSYIKYGDGPLKSLESLTFRPSEDENCFPIFSEPELALVCRALSDSMNFAPEDRFDEKWALLLKCTKTQMKIAEKYQDRPDGEMRKEGDPHK